jgi:hypothetical protein
MENVICMNSMIVVQIYRKTFSCIGLHAAYLLTVSKPGWASMTTPRVADFDWLLCSYIATQANTLRPLPASMQSFYGNIGKTQPSTFLSLTPPPFLNISLIANTAMPSRTLTDNLLSPFLQLVEFTVLRLKAPHLYMWGGLQNIISLHLKRAKVSPLLPAYGCFPHQYLNRQCNSYNFERENTLR